MRRREGSPHGETLSPGGRTLELLRAWESRDVQQSFCTGLGGKDQAPGSQERTRYANCITETCFQTRVKPIICLEVKM